MNAITDLFEECCSIIRDHIGDAESTSALAERNILLLRLSSLLQTVPKLAACATAPESITPAYINANTIRCLDLIETAWDALKRGDNGAAVDAVKDAAIAGLEASQRARNDPTLQGDIPDDMDPDDPRRSLIDLEGVQRRGDFRANQFPYDPDEDTDA
jgi:hypothetical protein